MVRSAAGRHKEKEADADMIKLLLAEDDSVIAEALTELLSREGFLVDAAAGQRQALALLEAGKYDLALLDVSLADGNGFALCAAIKAERDLPVLFLTAADDEFSVVTGLELGGDDYIAKPFRPRELVSRIRNVLRRYGRESRPAELGGVRVDTAKGVATKDGQELSLSPLEYRLLLLFLNNQGVTLTRARLLDELWDLAGDYVSDNTLTVYIKRLREKLGDDPQEPRLIRTVRGVGYRAGDGV